MSAYTVLSFRNSLKTLLLWCAVFCSAEAMAQYKLEVKELDSALFEGRFALEVRDTVQNRVVAAGYRGWSNFQVLTSSGVFDDGYVTFNRGEVYSNGNKVKITLKYQEKEQNSKMVKLPALKAFRLNYVDLPGNAGERLKLDVKILLNDDKVQSATHPRGYSWDDFLLTCRNDTFNNPKFFFIPQYVDSPEVLYLKATFRWDTSYFHYLPIDIHYADTLQFDFSGNDGRNGKTGKNGRSDQEYYRNGSYGSFGRIGENGMNVNVVLIPLESDMGDMIKLLFISDTFNHVLIIDPKRNHVILDISGGNGGRGGNGGNGANGIENSNNPRLTKGGDGGNGGNGGDGGTGGDMQLVTNQAGKEFAELITVKYDAGKAGLGGFGGAPGKTVIRPSAGFFEKKLRGSEGYEGDIGYTGLDGQSGMRPILWLVDDEEILALMLESETW